MAPGPLPVVRRGDQLLGARRDGPQAGRPRRGRRRGDHARAASRRRSTTHVPDPVDRDARSSPASSRSSALPTPRPAAASGCSPAGARSSSGSPRSGTVALVFEDLQWADDGLLDFIEHLLEWSRNHPIFILTLARPELLDRRPDVGRCRGASTSLALGPLADDEMRALLAGLVPGLPESARRSILARADGIPLYAVETVRMLRRRRPARGARRRLRAQSATSAPSRSRARCERSSPRASTASSRTPGPCVQDASVLGQTFSLDALVGVVRASSGPPWSRVSATSCGGRSWSSTPIRGLPSAASTASCRRCCARSPTRRSPCGTGARATSRRPGHFEALGDDELAGALATHYMAAYRTAAEGPEADAIAIQARHRSAGRRRARGGARLARFRRSRTCARRSRLPRTTPARRPAPGARRADRRARRPPRGCLRAARRGGGTLRAGGPTRRRRPGAGEPGLRPDVVRVGPRRGRHPRAPDGRLRRAALGARRRRGGSGAQPRASCRARVPAPRRWSGRPRPRDRRGPRPARHPRRRARRPRAPCCVTAGRNIESGVLLLAGVVRLAHQSGASTPSCGRAPSWSTPCTRRRPARRRSTRAATGGRRAAPRQVGDGPCSSTGRRPRWLCAPATGQAARQWLRSRWPWSPRARELVIIHWLRAPSMPRWPASIRPRPRRRSRSCRRADRQRGHVDGRSTTTPRRPGSPGSPAINATRARRRRRVCRTLTSSTSPTCRERAARAALWLGDAALARRAGRTTSRASATGAGRTPPACGASRRGSPPLEGRTAVTPSRGTARRSPAWRELACDGDLAFALLDVVRLLRPGDRRGS